MCKRALFWETKRVIRSAMSYECYFAKTLQEGLLENYGNKEARLIISFDM